MSLSKKNIDKLNKYLKNKNFNNDTNHLENKSNIDKHLNLNKNKLKSEDPNKIFYSLIDNSESLEVTTNLNHLQNNSEFNQINIDSQKANHFKKLTTEEELYDEFNYLLDE
jgi:hypothetical protein